MGLFYIWRRGWDTHPAPRPILVHFHHFVEMPHGYWCFHIFYIFFNFHIFHRLVPFSVLNRHQRHHSPEGPFLQDFEVQTNARRCPSHRDESPNNSTMYEVSCFLEGWIYSATEGL
jgi:hypothetical protein